MGYTILTVIEIETSMKSICRSNYNTESRFSYTKKSKAIAI